MNKDDIDKLKESIKYYYIDAINIFFINKRSKY
jgi:hypothetical protein